MPPDDPPPQPGAGGQRHIRVWDERDASRGGRSTQTPVGDGVHDRISDDVVVTGIGACTALGVDLDQTWRRLVAAECGASRHDDLAILDLPTDIACRVAEIDVHGPTRGGALATTAAAEALGDAGLATTSDVAVFVGTTMGESAAFEQHRSTGVPNGGTADSFATALADRFELSGPTRTYAAACAAGNYAIGGAADAIRRGRADVAIAGGVEPFSLIAMVGFARMRAMTPDRCRPFAAGRRGMQLGEGAAFLVVESAHHAEARGAPVLARIGRLGLSCDAHHPTRPLPDGSGMAAAMLSTLERSGLDPSDVGWINTHGTGTPASDAAEATAITDVFGAHAPPITSCKGALGHSLGAASAIEAAVTVKALGAGVIPPTANVDDADLELGVDLVTETRSTEGPVWAVNCGYAFGGLNSALCLGTP